MSLLLNLFSLSGIVDLALKSAAVMLLALMAAGLLSRASAARRHLVWCLAVASLQALPALSLSLPAWRVTWLPNWTAVEPRPAPREWVVLPQQPNKPFEIESVPVPSVREAPATEAPPIEEPATELLPLSNYLVAEVKRTPAASVSISWLAVAWGAGALLSLIPLAAGLCQLAALQRRSQVIKDERWLSLLTRLRRQLQVRRKVQLRQSKFALVPLTWGALNPVLLVPAEASDWPDERRHMVLLHELAHILRWDWLTQLVAHVACSLYWFNPLVWLASRQMRIERERACDDLVLSSGARASDYAQELLALATGLADSRLSTLVAVPMARRNALEDRLRGILDTRRSRAALTIGAACLGAALAAAIIAPLAMLRAAPAESAKAKAEELKQEPPMTEKPAAEKPAEKLAAKPFIVRGKVVDDATGKPIAEFIMQAGKFSPAANRITWGWHEERFSKGDGSFSTTIRRDEQWSARIVASGYFPHPVIASFPPADKDEIEVTLRLKRVPEKVRGVVLDHAGKPLKDAAVFAIGPTGLNVAAGQAWSEAPDFGKDNSARPVLTDERGRFELPTGEAISLGVSHAQFDAWPAPIPPSGEITIRLPEPARVEVNLDIDGADKEGVIFYQLLSDFMPEFAVGDRGGTVRRLQSSRRVKIANPGKLSLAALPPGKYQLARQGGIMIDRQIFEVKSGETKTFDFVRGKGARVRGKVTWPADAKLTGIFISVQSEKSEVLASMSPGGDGSFLTERIPPGSHHVIAYAFEEQTSERLRNTSPIPPAYEAQVKVDVPADGEVKGADLVLKRIRDRDPKTEPAKEKPAAEKPVEKAAENPVAKPAEKPAITAIEQVLVRGKAVDDVTGKPIGQFMMQGGKFDPADPQKVTWGYWERNFVAQDGSFDTTIRWPDGWTARIVADGFVPHPVLASAPPKGKENIEVTIRLKRGPKVRGVVLDHAGKPLKDAAVFPMHEGKMLNLAAGQAWSQAPDYGQDDRMRPARTDEQGRFELSTGGAKRLAVSHAQFDAWPAEIPDSGEVTVRLPKPARVEVNLDIDGAGNESVIFYQLLSNYTPEFGLLTSSRWVKIDNPGKISLAALTPGKYQLCRRPGTILERQLFEIAAGEAKAIDFVRKQGARVRGKVTWPAGAKITSIGVSVVGETTHKSPFDKFEWNPVYAALTPGEDGTFLTERIPPGTYQLQAYAYKPLTEQQQRRTGATAPSYHAQLKIEVPAEGELKVDDLALKSIRAEEPMQDPPVREKPAAERPAEKPAEWAAAPQKNPLMGKEAAEHVKKFPPSFSKAQEGVEIGIAIASDRKAFHEGERVPLELVIRNASQKTLHVEHGLYPPETPPTVIGAGGKQLSIDEIHLLGANRRYNDTLKPNEVAVYRHLGLGLGEKPNPPGTFWNPFLKSADVVPGKYRLSQELHLTVRKEGRDTGTSFRAVSGEVALEIVPADPKKDTEKQAEKPVEKPAQTAPTMVIFQGKVVDDLTGEKIDRFITQGGKFDPADPAKVNWGTWELRTLGRSDWFQTEIRWGEGLIARIVADGYLPEPVLTSAPEGGKKIVETTIRLKRGRKVRGVVLDHTGKPLKDAAVFPIGQSVVTMAAGEVLTPDGAKPARTDEGGRFELQVGVAKSLAVSHKQFDAWPAIIPESGEVTVRLPEPARVEINLDIDGADQESNIYYELIVSQMPEFRALVQGGVLRLDRYAKIANPGKLVLAGLPPGKYQLSRRPGRMLENQMFEIKSGEVKTIDYIRKTGARVRGKLTWPADAKLYDITVTVTGEPVQKSPWSDHQWATVYAALSPGKDGAFLTERIPPGTYELAAYASAPATGKDGLLSGFGGFSGPSYYAAVTIKVLAEGEVKVEDLELTSSKASK